MAGELPRPSTEPAAVALFDAAAAGVRTGVTNPDAANVPDSNRADVEHATPKEWRCAAKAARDAAFAYAAKAERDSANARICAALTARS
jgi:hypothetical protein